MTAFPTRLARVLSADPFSVGRDLDRAVQSFLGRESAGGAVDIWETADTVGVDVDLPGVSREDIDVTVERSTLTITAERKPQPTKDGHAWLLNERSPFKFQRSFTLNSAVDGGTVNATHEHGVLRVTLAKREESKPRKITVA